LSNNPNHILRTYLRRLTNLSGNSRSLLLLRLHHEQLIDLQKLSFLNGERAFEIIQSLIAEKSKKICPVLDSRREEVNEASRKLKRLQRVDKFIFDERGSNDLHVGWPFVRGKFSDGTLVRCPLLYFPVSIVQAQDQWVLVLRKDAGVTFNKSFLLAYSFYNQIKLDDELPDTSFEDFGKDSIVFRTHLYELLKGKIELNFNPDTFTDQLIPFEEFRKDEFNEQSHTGQLKLFNEGVLGIFPQAGSQLVPDYLHLIENQSVNDLETFFASRVNAAYDLRNWITSVKEEKVYAPFSLDAYQEHALRAIKSGNSLVVQGPPGTGKSQLISNLMADAVASGKKVLLVCQKRVALDVVYDRLVKTQLGDFLGLIHDFRNDRKEVYAKIARQINRIDDYKEWNRSIDIIQTERKFLHISRQIDHLTETLEEFRSALFNDREAGISAKELYLTSNPNADTINIRQEYQNFNFLTLDDFILKLRRFVRYASILERENNCWRERLSFASFQIGDRQQIENAIRDIHQVQQSIHDELNTIISISVNLEESESLLKRQPNVEEMLELLSDDTVFRYFISMLEEKDNETSLLWLQNMERVCLNCFDGEGIESSLRIDQIGLCQKAFQERTAAGKRFYKLIWWELFSDQKFFLKRVLITNRVKYDMAGLAILEKRIDNRLNLEHHFTALKAKKWLLELPESYDKKLLQHWFTAQSRALQAKLIFNSVRELRDVIHPPKYSLPEFKNCLHSIYSILSAIPQKRTEWMKFLSPYQVRQLILNPDLANEYVIALMEDFDSLCAFDGLKESLQAYELGVIQKLYESVGEWSGDQLTDLFQNSVRLAWIEHIEMKDPILRSVSTFAMLEMESELKQRVREKQQMVQEILLLRARERVYEGEEYNRLNNRVTYRDLLHQVTKKKKIWPVRKLIAEFQHELFNLLPCWMASPESVSAIFPMSEVFDLVIFDEASQCFSERGIPAMYRGKQVLVAGDSKQLKPFELYQVRWNDESEDPDAEVDSLLELSERYLPTVHLQGHYRSQSLPLIDFSNQFFYEGRLKLLPHRNVVNSAEPVIQFQKVNGTWESQTNIIEANAVIMHLIDLVKHHPEKEIGVITFNAPQQMLVMDLVEEKFAMENLAIPETLFIKNIENVQGDEKDIIIFSIGYAPDSNGKMNMQFGSLSVAGGENRLNVAVTRAREKVIVFSSIEPEQLNVQEIKNEGPRLLKKYLEYVREVSKGIFKPHSQENLKHSSNWYLNSQLANWIDQNKGEWSFSKNALPHADLVVSKGDKSLGIILTDDTLYHSSISVKEPHVYFPFLLEQKGWSYHRMFSRNWWLNREKSVNEINNYLNQLPNA